MPARITIRIQKHSFPPFTRNGIVLLTEGAAQCIGAAADGYGRRQRSERCAGSGSLALPLDVRLLHDPLHDLASNVLGSPLLLFLSAGSPPPGLLARRTSDPIPAHRDRAAT